MRLGPNASEAYPKRVFDLDATHSGIRKAGFREVIEVLRCPGQVGYLPSVATNAQLGFSVTTYQSAELLFDRRGGSGCVLVRLVGTCARAFKAKEADVAQHAEVGFRPRCAKRTHVAAPSSYSVGEFSSSKEQGISL